MKKILVADVPQMDGRYTSALADWEVRFVRTMGEARQALAGARYGLVAIGVYFDDSQMFDLVRALRADRVYREVPIVCVRGRAGFAVVSSRTLEVTLKALGADEFIDLLDVADEASVDTLRAVAERLTS
jgi:hypothetical protein